MITFKQGNLLESNCDIICHQVNCKGVMGAGIAKQIKNKWNNVYIEYKDFVVTNKYNRNKLLGCCYPVKVNAYQYVVNLFCQDTYGNNLEALTEYPAFDEALFKLKKFITSEYTNEYIKSNIRIGFPYKIGCGLAGGDWNVVLNLLHKHFDDDIWNVEIWELN